MAANERIVELSLAHERSRATVAVKTVKYWAPIILAIGVVCLGGFVAWRLHLGLPHLKFMLVHLGILRDRAPITFTFEFIAVYLLVTGLCIPIEPLLAIAAGALFGLFEGALIAALCTSIGATFSLGGARWLFRKSLTRHFGPQLARINDGIKRDGNIYILTLRLVPVFPYALVNVLLGLTNVSILTFFFCTFVGVLPASLIFVNAGTLLSNLTSLSQILSPALLLSLSALGALPWVAKGALVLWHKHAGTLIH